MIKEKIKFLDFVWQTGLFIIIFSLIFFYLKLSLHRDTIINFMPPTASYYWHIDLSQRNNTIIKKDLTKEMMQKLGFSSELINLLQFNFYQELAVAQINGENFLFLKTEKIQTLNNLLTTMQKPRQKINQQLIVIGKNDIKIKFPFQSNQLPRQFNPIKPTGQLLVWGFIRPEKLQELFFQPDVQLNNFLRPSNNLNNNFFFISQKKKDQLTFRLGELKTISNNEWWKNFASKNQSKKLKPLINQLNANTVFAVVLENFVSLKDYLDPKYLDLITKDLPTQYHLNLNLLNKYAKSKSELNIIEQDGQKNFLLALPLSKKDLSKQAAQIEQMLKNIILLTSIQEKDLILPDQTIAKQLVAPVEDLVRIEQILNKQKITTFRLPAKNFELAYAFFHNLLLISNTKEVLSETIKPLQKTKNLDHLLADCFLQPGQEILYLKNNYLQQLPIIVAPANFNNLLLTRINQGFFSGFEACLY